MILYSLLLKISDVLDEDLAKEIAFEEVPFKDINKILLNWYEDGVTDYLVQLDFQVLDEDGYETGLSVSNIPAVLESFHRIATICAFQVFAMGKANEKDAKEYVLWGGVGMTKFTQFV